MKKWVFLIFVIVYGLFSAQKTNLPIWENNYFEYNKFTVGKSLQNIVSLEIADDGSLLLQSVAKSIQKINNRTISTVLENENLNHNFLKAHTFADLQLFLFTNAVIIKKKNAEQYNILPSKIPYEINKISYHSNGTLYFLVKFPQSKISIVYGYNGKKLKKIMAVSQKEVLLINVQNKIYLLEKNKPLNKLLVYDLYSKSGLPIRTYPFYGESNFYFENFDSFFYENKQGITHYYYGENSQFLKSKSPQFAYSDFYQVNLDRTTQFYNPYNHFSRDFQLSNFETTIINKYCKATASLYISTNNKLIRAFQYIKKFPRIFYNNNASNIFSLAQTTDGKIWVGSYNGNLTSIKNKNNIEESTTFNHKIMNGGIGIENQFLVSTEQNQGNYLFSGINSYKKIEDSTIVYYNYIGKNNVLYAGTYLKGVMYKPLKYIENKAITWKFINEKQGLQLGSVNVISEDKYGHIWMGRATKGVAVYAPETGKVTNFLKEKNDIDFGSFTMQNDTFGTLWMGTTNGELVYWDGKNRSDIKKENLKKIKHPLLSSSEHFITFLHQWKNWLIIGAESHLYLLDLETWHKTKEVRLRYLSIEEANFTTSTEQNTIITDRNDQTIWFATSDMLYNWDIENWLKLPTEKVQPKVSIIIGDKKIIENTSHEKIKLRPSENSFDILVSYHSKGNLPRLIQNTLTQNNTIIYKNDLDTEDKITLKNLTAGDYLFTTTIFQQDGTFQTHQFPIKINQFIWEHWWFWIIISSIPFSFIVYYYRSKKELEKKKKEIIQLNVNTLSSHFRPHFMLNTLNSLGAELYDKPHAERIISRIGENINLMYAYSQNRDFCTPFSTEWKLVKNTLEIQKAIFIKELEVEVNHLEIMPKDLEIPMGLLQIGVENALLHGIRHRKNGPYKLTINFNSNPRHYLIEIIDNGVGREKSKKIYDFKKNGTGLKNLEELIKLINTNHKKAISMQITDSDEQNIEYPGTKLTIKVAKNIKYDKLVKKKPLQNKV